MLNEYSQVPESLDCKSILRMNKKMLSFVKFKVEPRRGFIELTVDKVPPSHINMLIKRMCGEPCIHRKCTYFSIFYPCHKLNKYVHWLSVEIQRER